MMPHLNDKTDSGREAAGYISRGLLITPVGCGRGAAGFFQQTA